MMHLKIALLLSLICGSCHALGYVRPRPSCTETDGPVIYRDPWEKRDCIGISLPMGEMMVESIQRPFYGHTIKVPMGYEVVVEKEPLFGFTRKTVYGEGTSRFVSYALWDTPIRRISVEKI